MSTIEKELLASTKIKPQGEKEDRQKYLNRLLSATWKLKDPVWNDLTKEAQDWVNDVSEVKMANDKAEKPTDKKPLEDFPDIEAEEATLAPEQEEGEVQEEEAETAAEAEPERAKPARVARASNGRKLSACHQIKLFVIKKPDISVKDLSAKLNQKGMKVTDLTISSIRSDVRDTLRVLNELKLGEYVL